MVIWGLVCTIYCKIQNDFAMYVADLCGLTYDGAKYHFTALKKSGISERSGGDKRFLGSKEVERKLPGKAKTTQNKHCRHPERGWFWYINTVTV